LLADPRSGFRSMSFRPRIMHRASTAFTNRPRNHLTNCSITFFFFSSNIHFPHTIKPRGSVSDSKAWTRARYPFHRVTHDNIDTITTAETRCRTLSEFFRTSCGFFVSKCVLLNNITAEIRFTTFIPEVSVRCTE